MVPRSVPPHFDDEPVRSSQYQDKRLAFLQPRLDRRKFLKLMASAMALAATSRIGAEPLASAPGTYAPEPSSDLPGWQGSLLIDGESLAHWTVEHDTGASGSLGLAPGLLGQAVQLNWNLGSGAWVQGRYTFPTPVNLSQADIFALSLQGGGPGEVANTVSLMFADVNNVFYGANMEGKASGVNQIDRWLINLPIPKAAFYFFFAFGDGAQIDWSRIDRFFVVVKRPASALGGGMGQLRIDQVQADTAANWSRQTEFFRATTTSQAASKAIEYLLSQQDPSTGLLVSWQEEELENPPPKAWLYDQALALIALTREGRFTHGVPANAAAQAARNLAGLLIRQQKSDGHWSRTWNPRTGAELLDDRWVGDQAWWVMALAGYANKFGDPSAMDSAQRGADWLVSQIDPMGKVVASTEGNVDVWWALLATSRLADAEKIKAYLLNATTVWDPNLRYWWRGFNDPVIAMDAATWLSAFARHPSVNQPERGQAALSFVRKTLLTRSQDGSLCGFDGMGPVSIWFEGTAQYVAAGGEDAQTFLEMLISQQNPDGSMPGSTENWSSDAFGWLTTWRGLAPTAWLYFAITGLPFPTPATFLPFILRDA